jgi:hypothetical protein
MQEQCAEDGALSAPACQHDLYMAASRNRTPALYSKAQMAFVLGLAEFGVVSIRGGRVGHSRQGGGASLAAPPVQLPFRQTHTGQHA